KSPQIIRRAIEMRRRKKVHPVVSPAKLPREIRDRHHLDDSDSNTRQLFQLLQSCMPGSFICKCPYVHFINDLALERKTGPSRIGPPKLPGIDDTGRSVRSIGLKA